MKYWDFYRKRMADGSGKERRVYCKEPIAGVKISVSNALSIKLNDCLGSRPVKNIWGGGGGG